MIPSKVLFVRNTQCSNAQHQFAVKMDKNRTNCYTYSFIPETSKEWNALPATVFPETHNLQLFKTRVYRYLRLLPNLKFSLLLFRMEGSILVSRSCIFSHQ